MIRMLCRNRVADFARWKAIFDSHQPAHQQAGLRLENLWRAIDDPNHVFFVFQVADLNQAKAFISAPDTAQTAAAAGVIEGEYWFVE